MLALKLLYHEELVKMIHFKKLLLLRTFLLVQWLRHRVCARPAWGLDPTCYN